MQIQLHIQTNTSTVTPTPHLLWLGCEDAKGVCSNAAEWNHMVVSYSAAHLKSLCREKYIIYSHLTMHLHILLLKSKIYFFVLLT